MIKINEGIKKIIENNAIALATINPNRNPHNIVVACVKVIENKLVITDVSMQETIKNLKSNNNVALVVWNKDWEKNCIGYELKGTAEYFEKGRWKDFVDNLSENKNEKVKGAILVIINQIKVLK